MCVEACQQKIAQTMSRRRFLRGATLTAAATALASCTGAESTSDTDTAPTNMMNLSYSRVVDLTHTLSEKFPSYFGTPQLSIETVAVAETDGFNGNRWTISEHVGTHLDAPFHFAGPDTADLIPVANLVGPLAVIDIRAKAEANADAQLTSDDLKAWEATHGQLPAGAIIAMNSGWEAFVQQDKFRNVDGEGVMHFPGFHLETIELLLAERDVKGIMSDTLSLDYGMSADFAVHYRWLPANRWGIENVAHLSQLPAVGATVIVGGPKVAGATGGPTRIIAFA